MTKILWFKKSRIWQFELLPKKNLPEKQKKWSLLLLQSLGVQAQHSQDYDNEIKSASVLRIKTSKSRASWSKCVSDVCSCSCRRFWSDGPAACRGRSSVCARAETPPPLSESFSSRRASAVSSSPYCHVSITWQKAGVNFLFYALPVITLFSSEPPECRGPQGVAWKA